MIDQILNITKIGIIYYQELELEISKIDTQLLKEQNKEIFLMVHL